MRMLLLAIFAFALSAAPVQAQSSKEKSHDWPGFLGPLGNSVSLEKGIIAPWPDKGLKVVWHKKLGTGYPPPSVSKGKLYVFDREGNQARLSCLDAKTGAFHWKFEYPTAYKDFFGYNNGPRCCAVIDGDRVYIHGAEGMLHCVKVDDGKLVWKVDTFAEFNVIQNFFGVGSAPIIEGDLLIVHVGGSPKGSNPREFMELKGNGSAVVAFNKYDGTVKYKISDELAGYASPVLATIDGRRWCFVFARGGLIAFNPADGKIDFHFPWRCEDIECVNAANPLVVGNLVLISETYGPGGVLLKVKPGGYEEVWSDAKKFKKSLQAHWNTPIHHNGYVYACSGRHTANGVLRCIELATAKIMWSEPRLTRTSLLMVDGHFVCQAEDGIVRLIKVNSEKYEEISRMEVNDPQTGELLLDYPCWAAPVLANGLLYLRGEDRLVCLELIPQK